MTTQVPYGPQTPVAAPAPPAPQYASPQYVAQQQQPPAPTYPTAPPWAATTPATGYGSVAPYGSPLPEYGQLLVRYPEEMQNAARAAAPATWPIAPMTLLVVPGLIATVRRAAAARRGRNNPAPYWITFAVSLAVTLAFGMVMKPMAVDAWHDFRERAHTKALQNHLVTDGRLAATARVTATSAACDATGPRGAGDQRRYTCLLRLEGGGTATLDVLAEPDGTWTAVPLRK